MLAVSYVGSPSLEQTRVAVLKFLALHELVDFPLGVAHRLDLVLVNGLLVDPSCVRPFRGSVGREDIFEEEGHGCHDHGKHKAESNFGITGLEHAVVYSRKELRGK